MPALPSAPVQVRRGVPYQAIIEDDLLLEPGFPRFVERLTAAWLGARNEARPETLLETPADLRSPPAHRPSKRREQHP